MKNNSMKISKIKRLGLSATVIFSIVAFIYLFANSNYAQTSDSQGKASNAVEPNKKEAKPIDIGGIVYSSDELIKDFINIAISNHGWLDDAPESTKKYAEVFTKSSYALDECKDLKMLDPVVTEYLCRENGIPQLNTLVKWNNEITIGLDWQRIAVTDNRTGKTFIRDSLHINPSALSYPESYPLFKEHVLYLLPDIKRLTGQAVTFIEPDDPRELRNLSDPNEQSNEQSEEPARIRIVPTNVIGTRTALPNEHGFSTLEPLFLNGVPFTPFEIGQVDGYILPDADNTIGFAVCRINPELGETLIRAMITECLARVLGLPNLSILNDNSVLSHWNKAAGQYTTAFFESRKTEEDKKFKNMKYAEDAVMAWRKTLPKYEYPLNLVDTKGHEKGFSAYDRFMIALLYCPAIKPGMNVQEAKEILQTNEVCWQQAEQKIKEN